MFENINWRGNERAVSPVIATILVVAIVVIISASLAAVTFGFTDNLGDPAPTVAFEYEYNKGWNITHTNGDSVDSSALQVRVDDPDGDATGVYEWPISGTVSAGTTADFNPSGVDIDGNEDVSVIWEDGDRSSSISSNSNSAASSSSGGGSGGGGAGVVDTIDGSFADDPTTAANEITVTVVDGVGDPVENEEITIRVANTTQGTLTAYDSVGNHYPNYFVEEQITVRTGSSGELETAIGGGSEDPLGKIKFVPDTGVVSSGDTISIKLESSSTSVEQEITYEYN